MGNWIVSLLHQCLLGIDIDAAQEVGGTSELVTWSEVIQHFVTIKLNYNLLIVGFIDLSVNT